MKNVNFKKGTTTTKKLFNSISACLHFLQNHCLTNMCIILQLPQATMLSYSFCMIAAAVALLTPCHAQNCAGAPELPSIPGVSGLLGLGGKNSNALHVHVVIITLQ